MIKQRGKAESGSALVLVLVLLAVGFLLTIPALDLAATGLDYHRVIDHNTQEIYAADAGVEYAICKLGNDWDSYYGSRLEHSLDVNGTTVNITAEHEGVKNYKITEVTTEGSVNGTSVESHVRLQPSIFDSALTAQNDITLGKDCTVNGDIDYGGNFTYGRGLNHTDGEIIAGEPDFPSQAENEAFALVLKNQALAGGNYTGDMNIPKGPATVPLGPLYISGNLNVLKDNIVVFNGTVYVAGSIDIDKDAEFVGTGSIVAEGDIGLAKTNNYGVDGSTVIMSLNGNITFKKEATVEALVYDHNGTISFDKSADITGAVVGSDIVVDKDAIVTYNASVNDIPDLPDGGGEIDILSYTISK